MLLTHGNAHNLGDGHLKAAAAAASEMVLLCSQALCHHSQKLLLLLFVTCSQALCHLQGLPAGRPVLVRCALHNGNFHGPGCTRNGEIINNGIRQIKNCRYCTLNATFCIGYV
jgi:hypothetical protein